MRGNFLFCDLLLNLFKSTSLCRFAEISNLRGIHYHSIVITIAIAIIVPIIIAITITITITIRDSEYAEDGEVGFGVQTLMDAESSAHKGFYISFF
jgi:hypothetical protein